MELKEQRYNMNLSPSYVPNWGAWEVAREFICNAMDADPDFVIENSSDTLVVKTKTSPDIGEMLMVGAGSKVASGDTIGQFGEGLKLACLAASRKGDVKISSGGKSFGFEFAEVFGRQSLHAVISEGGATEGMEVTVTMPGITMAVGNYILTDRSFGPKAKPVGSPMRVFIKGVFVSIVNGDALYDWNFDKLTLNRDRDMVRDFDVKWTIGVWLSQSITHEIAARMVDNSGSIEAKSTEYHRNSRVLQTLREAFIARHGEDAILATGLESDDAARRRGLNVVVIEHPELRGTLEAAGIQTTQAKVGRLDLVRAEKDYREEIAFLKRAGELVLAPNIRVSVFARRSDGVLGVANLDDMELWLSEDLFFDGVTHRTIGAYLHELAHFTSAARDCTREFENELTMMMGKIASLALGDFRLEAVAEPPKEVVNG